MRVALVTPASLLRRDGDSLRPLAQARGLWAAGFRDFTLFSPQPDPSLPYAQERIAVRGPLRLILTPIRGFDLVHAHQNAGLFQEGRVWADLHGFAPLESELAWRHRPLSPRAAAFTLISRWAARRLGRRCERLVCAAESIAENARRYLKVPPRIDVIRNCLDPGEFAPTACVEPIVGVIGAFMGRWGVPAFVMALQVAAACPGIRFRFIGPAHPGHYDDADRFANVEILGEVDEGAFERFLNEISISLLPFPDWCRGGGARQKLLRSAAAGLAVVATPAGLEGFVDAPEALVGNTPEELAALIRESLADPGERRRRGLGLRAVVEEQYNVYAEGRKLAELYESQKV